MDRVIVGGEPVFEADAELGRPLPFDSAPPDQVLAEPAAECGMIFHGHIVHQQGGVRRVENGVVRA